MNSPVDKALQLIRSQVPANVFKVLEQPLRQELTENLKYANDDEDPTDVLVDSLMALGNIFQEPVNDSKMEPLKTYLVNAALQTSEPNEKLRKAIEDMTLPGVLEKDPVHGCIDDPLVAALYAVCSMYPLSTPEHRLNTITDTFTEAAELLFDVT